MMSREEIKALWLNSSIPINADQSMKDNFVIERYVFYDDGTRISKGDKKVLDELISNYSIPVVPDNFYWVYRWLQCGLCRANKNKLSSEKEYAKGLEKELPLLEKMFDLFRDEEGVHQDITSISFEIKGEKFKFKSRRLVNEIAFFVYFGRRRILEQIGYKAERDSSKLIPNRSSLYGEKLNVISNHLHLVIKTQRQRYILIGKMARLALERTDEPLRVKLTNEEHDDDGLRKWVDDQIKSP